MTAADTKTIPANDAITPPRHGQTVLVLQGGGALGAYQAGVYQALHEAGIEPDWVIGTSIGAINASLIAGNPVQARLSRLQEFWARNRRAIIRPHRCGRPWASWSISICSIRGRRGSPSARRISAPVRCAIS